MFFAKILIEHTPKNHLEKHPSTQNNPLVVLCNEYSSGVARKNFLPRQSYTLTKLRGSISDSNDSQILLSIGGTALAGWMKELNRF